MTERVERAGPESPRRGNCVLSVVIVSWNTRQMLYECLTSAHAACREVDGPTEVIVVDNASADGSPQMVQESFPGVQLIANPHNRGFAAATNQGILRSIGRHVLLLNPDTTITPGALRLLVDFSREHPDVGAVGPRLVGRRGENQVSCFPLPTLTRECWRLFHLDRIHALATYPFGRWGTDTPRPVESVQGACMLIKREALQHAGLLDERFFVYTEETDLCRRLLAGGWKIFWVPRAVIVHYGAASTEQISGRMFLQLYRSKVQYFRKYLGAWGAVGYKVVLFAASVPRVVLPAIAMVAVPSRRTEWRALMQNYSSLLRHLSAL